MHEIHWTDSFSVGCSLIDEQHRRIIRMVNLLLRNRKISVSSETITDILTRMTKYARDHFAAEESLMAECGFPGLPEHKAKHLAYHRHMVLLCQDTMAHRASVPNDLLEYLVRWWTEHILVADMECRPFFTRCGVR